MSVKCVSETTEKHVGSNIFLTEYLGRTTSVYANRADYERNARVDARCAEAPFDSETAIRVSTRQNGSVGFSFVPRDFDIISAKLTPFCGDGDMEIV